MTSQTPHDSEDAASPAEQEPSRAAQLRLQLKQTLNILSVAFAPIAAAVALVVAIVAVVATHSAQTASGNINNQVEQMAARLSASQTEIERLKIELAQIKTMHDQEGSQQQEWMHKVTTSVSQLQSKARITPTLEEQLSPPATPAAPAAEAATPAQDSANSTVPPSTSTAAKTGNQIQSLKEALERFNNQKK